MKNKLTTIFTFLLILFCLFSAFFGTPDEGGQSIYDSMTVPVTESVAVTETLAVTEATTVPTEETPDSAAILDEAFALAEGEYLQGERTLTGTIVRVITPYSEKYDNITVEIRVPGSENRPIQCFRLEGSGVEELNVGDSITVTGQIVNYKGIIEFDAGCLLVDMVKGEAPEIPDAPVDDSKEAVAAFIHNYGCLPEFYMTKQEARNLFGWEGGALDLLAPGRAIGGDRFNNYEGQLPQATGRYYTECDIDTIGKSARGAKRIVFSNDGLVYYTNDHYDTFELLYGEP